MNGDVTSLYWPPIWLLAAAASNIGATIGGAAGGNIVYQGAAGVAPDSAGATPSTPAAAGFTAINQTTNEEWYVNLSGAWVQLIKV